MTRILRKVPDGNGISFLELLLNENLCAGNIKIEKDVAVQAGGVNMFLPSKRKYELFLRVAAEMSVELMDKEEEPDKSYLTLEDEEDMADGWRTDCYVVGKYSSVLRDNGVFNAVLETILEDAAAGGRYQETLEFMEEMIRQGKEYWKMDEGSRPILIYKGDDICHNVLNVFAEQFGAALSNAGKKVIYFDCGKEDVRRLTSYMHQHFQAVIGVQSYLFSVKMQDEIHYLHEYIYGAKYNFIFDHPVWMRQHLLHSYPDFPVLTHDENYVAFVKRYFGKDAILFPPAGMSSPQEEKKERIYDVTFVGTYGNYWNEVLLIHQMERKKRFIANRFLLKMRKCPALTAEQALAETLQEKDGSIPSDAEFLDLLYEMRRVIYCVMHYYRDRVMRSILQNGIRIDVYGDSWKMCPLRGYPNLICHPNVTVEESLAVWRQSKLSLNIMSWHKGGFTERMANIMLAGAVLITDYTTYLEGRYGEEDMVIFRLNERDTLGGRIRVLLDNETLRQKIAENGKRKTLQEHTWEKRAEQFLEIEERKDKVEM
jgi:hypothetical protein